MSVGACPNSSCTPCRVPGLIAPTPLDTYRLLLNKENESLVKRWVSCPVIVKLPSARFRVPILFLASDFKTFMSLAPLGIWSILWQYFLNDCLFVFSNCCIISGKGVSILIPITSHFSSIKEPSCVCPKLAGFYGPSNVCSLKCPQWELKGLYPTQSVS